jgi:hypothetical protein
MSTVKGRTPQTKNKALCGAARLGCPVKKISETLKKPLDKLQKMCYNKGRKRG